MNDALQQIGSYVGHLIKSRDRHGVHSPFVYELIHQVLSPKSAHPEFEAIERLRSKLLQSDQRITVLDLGAGSKHTSEPVRRVRDMAKRVLKPPHQAQMLFRLTRMLRPRHVLELGTSFGITSLYLAAGAEEGIVHTLEGCPQTMSIAQHHFDLLGNGRINPILGDFKDRLPETLRHMGTVDVAFLDGAHTRHATLENFERCLEFAHNDTVFIFDDIHWSKDMEAAWRAIKAHGRVTVSVDLYAMGLVFLRKEQAKEHFTLRY